jgi:hypothetical protein
MMISSQGELVEVEETAADDEDEKELKRVRSKVDTVSGDIWILGVGKVTYTPAELSPKQVL